MQRENLSRETGFLAHAGCAIGMGNVWLFQKHMGEKTAADYSCFILHFFVLMEFRSYNGACRDTWRASRKSAALSYKHLKTKRANGTFTVGCA